MGCNYSKRYGSYELGLWPGLLRALTLIRVRVAGQVMAVEAPISSDLAVVAVAIHCPEQMLELELGLDVYASNLA